MATLAKKTKNQSAAQREKRRLNLLTRAETQLVRHIDFDQFQSPAFKEDVHDVERRAMVTQGRTQAALPGKPMTVQGAVALLISRHGARRAMPYIYRIFKTHSDNAHAGFRRNLIQDALNFDSPAVLPLLARALRDKNATIRIHAAEKLFQYKHAAHATLARAAVEDSEPMVRGTAFTRLALDRQQGTPSVPEQVARKLALAHVHDSDQTVRLGALRILNKTPHVDNVIPLIECLGSTIPAEQLAAASALISINHPRASTGLAQLFTPANIANTRQSPKDVVIIGKAAQIVGAQGHPDAAPELIDLLGKPMRSTDHDDIVKSLQRIADPTNVQPTHYPHVLAALRATLPTLVGSVEHGGPPLVLPAVRSTIQAAYKVDVRRRFQNPQTLLLHYRQAVSAAQRNRSK